MSSSHTKSHRGGKGKTKAELLHELKDLQDKIDFLTDELQRKDEGLEVQKADAQAQNEALMVKSKGLKAQDEELKVNHGELERDITERKKIKEALKRLARRNEEALRVANIGHWELDVASRTFVFNDQFYKIHGITAEDAGGYTMAAEEYVRKYVHPDYVDFMHGLFRTVTSTADPEFTGSYEGCILHADGKPRYMSAWCRVEMDEQGRVIRVHGVNQDITERKLAEDALRASEARFNEVLDNLTDAFMIIDSKWRLVYVNEIAAKRFGVSKEQLLGQVVWDLWPQSVGSIQYEQLSKTMDDKIQRTWIKRSTSTDIWYEYRAFPWGDGIASFARDITERKWAEDVLLESEARYRAVVEDQTEMIARMLPDWTITFVNEACKHFWGIAPHQFIGKKLLNFIPPPYHGRVKAALECIISEKDFGIYEDSMINPDGSVRWLQWSFRGIFDEQHRLKEYQIVMRDITDLKRVEAALNGAKQQAELYVDLMGHDINNAHQIAMGYLELARDMHVDAKQAEFLDMSMEMLQRSALLIDNVRKLQKVNDGVYCKEQVDVCNVLKDVVREYSAVPNKTIIFNDYRNEHYIVLANELLHDVFSNLVSNAIKHSNRDYETIIIDIDSVHENGIQYYRVMVEDNGPGITDDFKDKVFNRLLRGTTKSKGMGLGLYLVKTLVDSYNGMVWVEDRIIGDHTKGARFVVMLPAIEK